MIKLFWNTHNHKKTITEDQDIKKNEAVEFKWGIYHKKNSDLWIYEILKKIKYDIIDSEKNLEQGDTLIIVDSNPEKKIELYDKLNLICSKILLFHLGDETGIFDLSQVYNKFSYVLRTFVQISILQIVKSNAYLLDTNLGLSIGKQITENINGPLQALLTNQVDMICYFNFLILNRFFVIKLRNLIQKSFQLKK